TATLSWSRGSNYSSLAVDGSRSPNVTAVHACALPLLSSGTALLTLPSGYLVAGTDYRWDVTACSGSGGTGTCVTNPTNAYFSTRSEERPAGKASRSRCQDITTHKRTLSWSGGGRSS